VQNEKRAIADAALGDSDVAAGAPTRLTLVELRRLFGLGGGQPRANRRNAD
jgi:hypothetical protein